MSGSSRSPRLPENWHPGQEYWIYLPATANLSDFHPPRRSLNHRGRTRDPWIVLEERFIGSPTPGLASFPPAATPRSSIPLLFIEDAYPRARPVPDSPPFYQPWNNARSRENESRLSPEEQNQAVNKLRKQFYSPHINSIIKRLGTKPAAGSGSGGGGSPDDDVGKRCAVCLEDFETKQFVTTTPCNHMFHEDCIVPWVKSQGKCPVCRYVIVEKTPPRWSGSSSSVSVRRGGGGRSLIF